MVRLLDTTGPRNKCITQTGKRSASLLSIRQSLHYQASIGLNDLPHLQQRCKLDELEHLLGQIRQILNREFGALRVHRYRQGFAVSHRELEPLVGGLLRVQYHTRQLTMPAIKEQGAVLLSRVPSLRWGVGQTLVEADSDRLTRQRPQR